MAPNYPNKWRALVDYFIAPELLTDWILATRARILVGILLMSIAITAILLVDALTGSSRPYLLPYLCFLSVPLAIEVFCLVLMRSAHLFKLIQNIFVGQAYLFVFFAIVLSGGFPNSPYLQVLLIVPVYRFLLGGRIAGLIWTAVVITTLLFFYFLHQSGIQFEATAIEVNKNQYLEGWFVNCAIVIGSLFVYESITNNLTSMLHLQSNHFAYQATHDVLTALPNRVFFLQCLQETILHAKAYDLYSALLYIDIDGFKPINDINGHHVGDYVLQELARRMNSIVRKSDVVARIGGDEFAIILEDVCSRSVLEGVLKKILVCLAAPITYEQQQLLVSGSIGVVLIIKDGEEVDVLCQRADSAMYRAKQKGNDYFFCGDELDS